MNKPQLPALRRDALSRVPVLTCHLFTPMGIKFLSLQMIPLCFHVVGGTDRTHPSDPPSSPSGTTTTKSSADIATTVRSIKLVSADGRVEVFHRRVKASEVMNLHPLHLVCRSDAFTIGQRIPALPEGEELQPGHAYFLLPVHFFQSVLSFVTLASSFARAAAAAASSSNGGSSPSTLLQRPFDVHKTPSGKLQIRVSDEFIQRIQEAQGGGDRGREGGGGRVCTTAALEKDYRQLVVGCRERQWRPKLETITESEKTRRGLVGVGGIRRRRKKSHQSDHHSHEEKQQLQQNQEKQKQQKKQEQKVSAIPKHLYSPPRHNQEQRQQQQQQQKKQKHKAKHLNSPSGDTQEEQIQKQRQQQLEKTQKQKVSAIAKRLSSLPSHKNRENKVVARHQ